MDIRNPKNAILQAFHPDPHSLLELLCREVKSNTLWIIAEADYGDSAEEYLAILERIKREKRIPKMHFDVALAEAVNLTRWRKPEDGTWNRYVPEQERNLAIAFSCTILLAVPSEWYHNRMGEHSTVIRLIQASRSLSFILPEILEIVATLLAWRITNNETETEDLPFFIYGLLLCGILGRLATESQLLALANHLIAEENRCRKMLQELFYDDLKKDWLLGVTSFDQLHDDWRSSTEWLQKESPRFEDPALRKLLKEIAEKLMQ